MIAALCGYLPLALRIAGARLAAKPRWRLQRLAHRLAEQQRRLDELTAGDLEVRASVGLSYYGLGEREQRAFRLLGLLEVPDFAPWMLAALLDIPAPEAEEVADHLADAQLLDPIGDDATGQLRYRFHDLLRLYARERLAAEDTSATRRAALERTLQTYFERAQEAVSQLRLRPPELPGATAPAPPHDAQGGLAAAYQWLATEHTGLAVSLDQAWREGLGGLGQALTRLLADFFEVYACRDEWEQTHEMALRAARRAGDRHAEASLLRGLGDLRRFQDRLPEAATLFTGSNVIFRELGDTGGEVDSLTGLARTYRRQDRLAEAASCFEECLGLCRGLDDPDREAKAMLFFAKVRRQQGRLEDALAPPDIQPGNLPFGQQRRICRLHRSDDRNHVQRARRIRPGRRSSRAGADLRTGTWRPALGSLCPAQPRGGGPRTRIARTRRAETSNDPWPCSSKPATGKEPVIARQLIAGLGQAAARRA